MTAALLWKEYRQQRAVWLAIAILGILLVSILIAVTGHGTRLEDFHNRHIRALLNAVVFCLVITYGLLSGALLLAGERDDGTMVFLDYLTGQRGTLWARKCVAGSLFTLFQSLVQAGMAVGLGFMSWHTALALPLLGLNGLAWGLLAGALSRTVFIAVLTGIALMAGSWLWSIISMTPLDLTLVEGAVAIGAGYASRQIFCRDDRSRLFEPNGPKIKRLGRLPGSVQVLLWLIIRQGRWVLAACVAGALLLSFTFNLAPLILWPCVTLLLGLSLGLAAFAPDQKEGFRFLGSQRFPPGTLWAVKVLFWGFAAIVLTALPWFAGTALVMAWRNLFHQWIENPISPSYWVGQWMEYRAFSRPADAILLVGIWSLYGFAFGQLFGQLARRPVIAVSLAFFLAVLAICLWLPSLLVGGVLVWQVLMLPVLMLLTTNLALRPWLAGRLWAARPLFAICGLAALMVISVAGCLWYRAVEVPDVGEPFDVKAFLASLPTPEQNQAGPLIQHAALAMQEDRRKVAQNSLNDKPDAGLVKDVRVTRLLIAHQPIIDSAIMNGWPKQDEEIGHFLDQLFKGEWVKESRKVAELPLGMVKDPRLASWDQVDAETPGRLVFLARLFSARALQLQAQGNSSDGLKHLDTALALTRQVQNYATDSLLIAASQMENETLSALQRWLKSLGPDRELLQAALTMLQRHEAARPNLANSIKAAYLARRDKVQPNFYGPGPTAILQNMMLLVPWEKERQTRIMQAIAGGALRLSQNPGFNESAGSNRSPDSLAAAAAFRGLPPPEGPGSNLSATQWGEFIKQRSDPSILNEPWRFAEANQRGLHAAQLITILALYQVDHGEQPAKLEDLVPAYLAKLPVDPSTGGPFVYRVFGRELIPNRFGQALKLALGQAYISSSNDRLGVYPVLFWPKQKEDQP